MLDDVLEPKRSAGQLDGSPAPHSRRTGLADREADRSSQMTTALATSTMASKPKLKASLMQPISTKMLNERSTSEATAGELERKGLIGVRVSGGSFPSLQCVSMLPPGRQFHRWLRAGDHDGGKPSREGWMLRGRNRCATTPQPVGIEGR